MSNAALGSTFGSKAKCKATLVGSSICDFCICYLRQSSKLRSKWWQVHQVILYFDAVQSSREFAQGNLKCWSTGCNDLRDSWYRWSQIDDRQWVGKSYSTFNRLRDLTSQWAGKKDSFWKCSKLLEECLSAVHPIWIWEKASNFCTSAMSHVSSILAPSFHGACQGRWCPRLSKCGNSNFKVSLIALGQQWHVQPKQRKQEPKKEEEWRR